MGNQWGLGLHLIFVTIFLVATTTNTCFGARNTSVACFEHERIDLLEFKHSVTDRFEMLSSWVGNDCCQWERVQCDVVSGHVEILHLRGFINYDYSSYEREEYLVGNEVKSSLAELSQLKYLDLSQNYFQESRIPEFIGSFKHLIYLDLSYADFSGNIPHQIGNLSNLKVLDLSSRYTDKPLMVDDMAWISGLSSLKYIDLRFVNLSRAQNYDMVFYMIPSLEVLWLRRCDISSNFPHLNSSATLSNIKHLDLSLNNFIGQLPGFFQNMTSLKFLDLSNFNLSMSWNFANLLNIIPSLQEVHLSGCGIQNMHLSPTYHNFNKLSNIQLLDLSWNSFEGKFPSVLTNLSSLRDLDLSDCNLNSTVPIMPNLLVLDLSSNHFKHIEQLGNWRQCHLKQLKVTFSSFDIQMNDSPTTNVSECSQYALERLILSENELKGPIPESLVRLRLLEVLDLSKNQLNGSIPESLVRLRLFEVLDLSENQLNGSIPESLGRLVTLKHLFLSDNHLTGPIPTSLGTLVSLQSFSVSSNLLNGTIPVQVWQLTNLYSLDMYNNFLEGVVSAAHFYNLSMLELLSLANNTLTGNISREWMPSFQLLAVDLSFCKIEDEFPKWLRTQRNLQFLGLSNNSISGTLPTWLRKMPIKLLDLSHNNLSRPLTNFLMEIKFIILHMHYICKITFSMSRFHYFRFKLPGNIPEWIGEKFTKLVIFRLHKNHFTGQIPPSLCRNSNLQILDVAHNNLTGPIPHCLGSLNGMITIGSIN